MACFPETVSLRDWPYTRAVAMAGVPRARLCLAVPGHVSMGFGDGRRPRGAGPCPHLVTYTASLALKRL